MASNLIVRTVFVLMLACIPCWALSANQQSYLGAAIQYEVRDATVDDASDITDVFYDAFSPSDSFKYVHQFRDQYPGYYRRCWGQSIHRMLAGPQANDTAWRVLSIPDKTAQKGTRVVSVSSWDFMGTSNESFWSMAAADGGGGYDDDCAKRLDENVTRADYQLQQLMAAKKTFIDNAYGAQVYLGGLATHPNWDGHGFAAVLVHWGMALAHKMAVPATLIGSPAGHPLYRSLGFEDVKNLTIKSLDGPERSWWCEVMVLESP
jgi:GNAT superfamily N-acetyltransferase